MGHLSYGISHPRELFAKLRWEGDRLTPSPHAYDVFNFILTAAVLAEWLQIFYRAASAPEHFSAPTNERKTWLLPRMTQQWISDVSCVPNPHDGIERHVENVLSICLQTANASKHFRWTDRGDIRSIGETPPINSFYSYFFTSTEPDLYLEFQGENYGLQQIKGILLQFYAGQISYLEVLEQ
jgi:hypothetical protein